MMDLGVDLTASVESMGLVTSMESMISVENIELVESVKLMISVESIELAVSVELTVSVELIEYIELMVSVKQVWINGEYSKVDGKCRASVECRVYSEHRVSVELMVSVVELTVRAVELTVRAVELMASVVELTVSVG